MEGTITLETHFPGLFTSWTIKKREKRHGSQNSLLLPSELGSLEGSAPCAYMWVEETTPACQKDGDDMGVDSCRLEGHARPSLPQRGRAMGAHLGDYDDYEKWDSPELSEPFSHTFYL